MKIQWLCDFINDTKLSFFRVKMYWMKSIHVLFWRVIENDWMFFFNEQMTIINNNWTKSIISTFSGETAGNNSNNPLFPMLKSCQVFNLTIISLRITSIKLKCFQENKVVYYCRPIDRTMSTTPIQSPYVSNKPREDPDHHQVETWTLKCTRWIRTTETLTTLSFDTLDSVRIDHFPNVCFLLIVSDN